MNEWRERESRLGKMHLRCLLLDSRPATLSPRLHFSPQIPPIPPPSPCLCLCCALFLECPLLFSQSSPPASPSLLQTTPDSHHLYRGLPLSPCLCLSILLQGKPELQLCHPEQEPRKCCETAEELALREGWAWTLCPQTR